MGSVKKNQNINQRIYRLTIGLLISLNLLLAACGNEETDKVEADKNLVQEAADSEKETDLTEAEGKPANWEVPEAKSDKPTVLEAIETESGTTMDLSQLYSQKHPIVGAEDFEGSWNRTNISSSLSGWVEITNQDETGFWFTGEFYYYSHTGTAEGQAYFITEDMAIYEYVTDIDTDREYILFKKQENQLDIVASASFGELGFGASVMADGEYTQETPVYTNADVLQENFDSSQQEEIRRMLGEDFYQEYFVWIVENGILSVQECILEEGGTATYYQGFVPTMGGYSFELLSCEDGRLYFLSESDTVGYQTNTQGELDFPVYYIQDEGH